MSTKNNAFVALAALALGLTVTVGVGPVCEGLLNDYPVDTFGAAEIDASGRVLVLVTVDGEVRPVADAMGNVRLYGDGNAAIALAKRSNITTGVEMKFVKMAKQAAVGDPILALKSKYKKFKAEALVSLKQSQTISAKLAAAEALGWNTAEGTPEGAEYADMVVRQGSIGEWKSYNDTKITTMAASLTAAGIDPATVT